MASEKQKAASRASARTVVLDGESRPRFGALTTSPQEELKPGATTEDLLIHKNGRGPLAADVRLGHGTLRPLAGLGTAESPDVPTRDALAFGKSGVHLNEYEMRFDRQFTRALNRLKQFRATRTHHVQQTKAQEAPQ